MRRFCACKLRDRAVEGRFDSHTQSIISHHSPKEEADRLWSNARQSVWFSPVIKRLRKITGKGSPCMYCDSNESNNVEHFYPKAVFPEKTFDFLNYLWVCGICNQSKLDRFPPDTEAGARIINPLAEDVWMFFYIDRFGNLSPLWDPVRNDVNERAQNTIRIVGLDRQDLQCRRKARLRQLLTSVRDTVALLKSGKITQKKALLRMKHWCSHPFQPDVADYYLNGPGKSHYLIRRFLSAVGSVEPKGSRRA